MLPAWSAERGIRWSALRRVLHDKGIRVIELEEGQPYDVGSAVQPLNIHEFDLENENPVIDQVLEPTVVGHTGLLRPGRRTEENLEMTAYVGIATSVPQIVRSLLI